MNSFFLLADDDYDDAELFQEALTSVDPQIAFRHVENGEAVLNFLTSESSGKPDIIFLDLNMPAMSGWQCLAKLKNNAQLKEIPVVMYSTSSNLREKEIAMDLGAVGFVTKPTEFTTLIDILQAIVRNLRGDLKKILGKSLS